MFIVDRVINVSALYAMKVLNIKINILQRYHSLARYLSFKLLLIAAMASGVI